MVASRPFATLLLHRVLLIEGEVELQHIDPRLAEKSKLASGGVRVDEATDVRFGDAPLPRDPWYLKLCRRRRDVRVEAGGRRGHKVDRDRSIRVLLMCIVDRRLH